MLQYADDTILCIQDEMESVQNMKILLCIFERMTGLKIKFDKSEALMISHDEQKALVFADIMNCNTGSWPIKYLGGPVLDSRVRVTEWIQVLEKLLKRLDGWQGSAFPLVEGSLLINSCLRSIPHIVCLCTFYQRPS